MNESKILILVACLAKIQLSVTGWIFRMEAGADPIVRTTVLTATVGAAFVFAAATLMLYSTI